MSEMVETVARAMMAVVREASDERLDPERFRQFARAAIEAMREPTEEMREASRYYLGAGFQVDPQYHAMIDTALKG